LSFAKENRIGMERYNLPNDVQLSFQKEVLVGSFGAQEVAA
jgi:hypothetical protein